jgi:PAS domain S-box-containing protein
MTEYTASLPAWRPAIALYHLLARYPLRVTIPSLCLTCFLLVLADTYVHEFRLNRDHALARVTERVTATSNEAAEQLTHALESHHEGDVAATFLALAAQPDFEAGVLVGADGKVMAASDARRRDQAFDKQAFGLYGEHGTRLGTEAVGTRMFAVAPVMASDGEGHAKEVARLYRRDRLGSVLAEASAVARTESARHGIEFGAVLLLLWWVSERVYRARLSCLERAARAVSGGELGARARLDGADELAHLALGFNQMVARLESDRGCAIEQSRALATSNAELEALRKALDAHAIVSITDEFGSIVHANDKFCEISGYSREDLLGQNHRLLKSGAHDEEVYRQLWTTIRDGRAWHGVLQNRRKDGAPYWVQSSILPLGSGGASHGGYISLRTDITERERLRLALERLARADVLQEPFDLFSEALAYGLDASRAGIVRFVENNQRQRLLGSWPRRAEDEESPLLGSAAAIRDGAAGFSQCACLNSLFPDDPLLAGHDQECLYAEPIVDLAGTPIGMLFALRPCRPLDEAGMRALLATVARRAAGEMQRLSMERAQARQQAWLEFVIKGAGAGVWDWDLGTDAVQFNEQWAAMLGYRLADLAPNVETWKRLIHPDDAEFTIAAVAGHLAGHTSQYESEHRLRTADGGYVWVLDRGTITVRAPDGRPLRMSGVHIDITQFKKAQAALQAQQQRLDLVLENVPIGLWELDLADSTVSTTPQWLERLGIPQALQPRTNGDWARMIHPDDRDRVRSAFGDYLKGRSSTYVVDFRIAAQDGSWHWILSRGVISARDDSGRATRMTGIHVDLQEQREAEANLRENEARLQLVIRAGDLGVWDWNTESHVFTHNPHMAAMLGYAADELPTREHWLALIHPDDLPASHYAMRAYLSGTAPFFGSEVRLRTKHGQWRWIITRGQIVQRDAKGRAQRLIGIHLDINDKKLAEAALMSSEERLRAVLDNSPIGIFWTDSSGAVQYINGSLRQNFALRADQGLGDSWLEFLHPDDQERMLSSWRSFMASEDERYDVEYRYVFPELGVRTVHAQAARTHSRSGALGFVGTIEDITAARESEVERERLRLQVQQAQKMEAVGQLAGGIAHDFNNILASVIGFGTLARERFATDAQSKLAEYLNAVVTAGERGRDLVAKMLAFSRAAPSGQAHAVEPVAVAREVTHLLSTIIPSSIHFDLEVHEPVPPVLIDAVDVHQILVNLVVNARDAVSSHGHILITIDGDGARDGHCAACQAPIDGNYVAISVRDDGCGMDQPTVARIFDPFFTTKDVGKGTGMGLSVVHGIMHRAGGHVLVNSTPGVGTEFVLLLRQAAGAISNVTTAARQAAVVAGLRVLVVDDEPLVRNFVGELLSGEGAQATLAADGREAQAVFAAQPDDFDVVFTDQTMPGLTGLELTAALREVRADVPVVLYSGYSDRTTRDVAQAGGVVFLGKPADPQAVLDALQTAARSAPVI